MTQKKRKRVSKAEIVETINLGKQAAATTQEAAAKLRESFPVNIDGSPMHAWGPADGLIETPPITLPKHPLVELPEMPPYRPFIPEDFDGRTIIACNGEPVLKVITPPAPPSTFWQRLRFLFTGK